MTDLVALSQTRGQRPTSLPRGLVLIGLALGSWVVLAVVVVLALRGLSLL